MTGDEHIDDPGPVAEYRDPELAGRFEAEPVPDHRPGFWSELESNLQGRSADLSGAPGEAGAPGHAGEPTHLIDRRGPLELVSAGAGDRTGDGSADRRWGPSRWLAAAAAVAVLAGLTGVALVANGRPSSPVESAAPTPSPTAGPTTTTVGSSTTGSTSTDPSGSAPATSTTTSDRSSTTAGTVGADADRFDVEVGVRSIGRGQVVGFSADDSALLVVDDAPGVTLGCEGAELLALYAQDLATGRRQPALDDGATVETGGLRLRIPPFGSSPPSVGTRPVYWSDWCDGSAGPVRRGVLAADGRITMVESVASGSDDDPFARESEALRPGGGQVSPDGTRAVSLTGGIAEVVSIGAGTTMTWELPAALAGETVASASWSPDGEVVALGTDDSVIVWSPDTGRHRDFETGPVQGLVFANDGRRLAVTVWDGTSLRSTILSFGPLPEPVPAPARCSGAVELTPLAPAGSSDRPWPEAVAATATAIDEAAATCDWEALDQLTGEAFTASFGGDDPLPLWRDDEAAGGSPMWSLRVLLRQEPAVDGALGDPIDPARWVWPSFHLSPDCQFDQDDRATLEALGYDPDQMVVECRSVGGYLGHRTAIDETGVWRYFVAGD